MHYTICNTERATGSELAQIVEPLVNYVCSAEQPRAALISALALLCDEVRQTHALAHSHLTTFAENRWS